jgi:hypothetical protein
MQRDLADNRADYQIAGMENGSGIFILEYYPVI